MYPNPQDVLPLPPRPSLEQYKKRAKDLVKACKSGDAAAIRRWAIHWIESLTALDGLGGESPTRASIERRAEQLTEFALKKLAADDNEAACVLADAQFVVARAQGFQSWPKFAHHLEELALARSAVSAFERAADAIVAGDGQTVERILRGSPDLIYARSTREHRATLLHYVAANGVENYRQRTPKNIVSIAEMLLQSGAEVDADANVYGGGATTLGLAATSAHPRKAGVQIDLLEVLLKHGATIDSPDAAGNRQSAVHGCLANGCPQAAAYLADRGAMLDLEGACGIGRLDVVKTFFDEEGRLKSPATLAQMQAGFSYACWYGQPSVVDFLLQHGMDVNAKIRAEGQTCLHSAAYAGQPEIVRVLLQRGADVHIVDNTWHTPPLVWALYAWTEDEHIRSERHYDVVRMLVAAGSIVKPEWLEDEKVRTDPRMLAALAPPPAR